ncbi:hypothetical protein [Ruminococcus sp. YE71]|nr:hypothetical protein [Ruminococcus sp. YE71]
MAGDELVSRDRCTPRPVKTTSEKYKQVSEAATSQAMKVGIWVHP